jgi:hypothetical protein
LRLYADRECKPAVQEFLAAFDLQVVRVRTPAERGGSLNAAGLRLSCRVLCQLEAEGEAISTDDLFARLERAAIAFEGDEKAPVNTPVATLFAAELRLRQASCLLKHKQVDKSAAVLELGLRSAEARFDDDPCSEQRRAVRWLICATLAGVETKRERFALAVMRMQEAYQVFVRLAEELPQRTEQSEVETIPLDLANTVVRRAKQLDPTKADENAERVRLLAAAREALLWMEKTIAARKLVLSPYAQARTAALIKELDADK